MKIVVDVQKNSVGEMMKIHWSKTSAIYRYLVLCMYIFMHVRMYKISD